MENNKLMKIISNMNNRLNRYSSSKEVKRMEIIRPNQHIRIRKMERIR